MDVEGNLTALAAHLKGNRWDLLHLWKEAVYNEPRCLIANTLPEGEFFDHLPIAFPKFADAMSSGSDIKEAVASDLVQHGHHRWQHGYTIVELLVEWHLLHHVLANAVETFDYASEGAAEARRRAVVAVSTFTDEGMILSVRRFDRMRELQAETQLRDLIAVREKVEALNKDRGVMLREATHDLRSQLTVVTGAAELLETEGSSSMSKEAVGLLKESTDQLLLMINSLLQLARIEAGQEELDLKQVDIAQELLNLGRSTEYLARRKGIGLRVETPPSLLVVTDPVKIRRISQNILINAINHTKQGEVSLICRDINEGRWILEISDSGSGLPEHAREMLGGGSAKGNGRARPSSDHSSTTGEGIGLTIVKRLAALLQAKVSVDSAEGRGTTFTLTFPNAPAGLIVDHKLQLF